MAPLAPPSAVQSEGVRQPKCSLLFPYSARGGPGAGAPTAAGQQEALRGLRRCSERAACGLSGRGRPGAAQLSPRPARGSASPWGCAGDPWLLGCQEGPPHVERVQRPAWEGTAGVRQGG